VLENGSVETRDAVRLVEKLRAGFPHQALTDAHVETYVRYLRDLDAAATEALVEELIATSVDFPRIAELRRPLIEAAAGIPEPADAYRSLSEPGGDVHQLARDVRELMGGVWAFKTSENPGITRAQFLKLYAEKRDELLRRANVTHFRSAA
jgi:hypothetical protein